MTVYQNDFVGSDEKQLCLQNISVDGNTVLFRVGFNEAMGYVNNHIQTGDTYIESEYGVVYATIYGDEFIYTVRPILPVL